MIEQNYNEEYIWFDIKYKRIKISIGYCIGLTRYTVSIRKKGKNTISFGDWYFRDVIKKIISIVFGDGLIKNYCQIRCLKKKLYKNWYKYINTSKNMI